MAVLDYWCMTSLSVEGGIHLVLVFLSMAHIKREILTDPLITCRARPVPAAAAIAYLWCSGLGNGYVTDVINNYRS